MASRKSGPQRRTVRPKAAAADRRLTRAGTAVDGAPRPRAGSRGELALGHALTITHIGRIAREFRQRPDGSFPSLTARSLQSVDSAGVQWLLVAALAAQRSGQRLKVHGAGPLLTDAASALGLGEQLSASMELSE
jgi:hypothetical protein